jgi:HSP20 family protein
MKGDTMALPTKRHPEQARLAGRADPLGEFADIQSQMDRLLESLWTGGGPGNGGLWIPSVDIEETEDAWVVEAELPGAQQDDVNVELRDSELVIHGEIKEKERKGIIRRRTRRTGRFEYRVILPGEPDADNVDATLDGGVLTVRIPKGERNRSREIPITAGQASREPAGQRTA